MDLTDETLKKASRGANKLGEAIEDMKAQDSEKLQNEYEQLVEGLRQAEIARDQELFMANPVLPQDLLDEAIPGNIRKGEHFIAFLKRLLSI